MSKWVVAAKRADFQGIADRLGLDPVIVRILRNRDMLDEESMRSFISGADAAYHDPNLLKDMDKAVSILDKAISDGEHIRIIGDYDVDGVTSTYILLKGLRHLGAKADYAIPDRVIDGYGINVNLINKAHEDGATLILTCDNGIAAPDAILRASELGMRCIITDHHEVPYEGEGDDKTYIYPKASAIINPKRHDTAYPFTGICGAMVAYKLMLALSRIRPVSKDVLDELTEMAGFGTVCDVMELTDENRTVVKQALALMNNSHNPGIAALRRVCEIDNNPVSAHHLGFILGPCVNATGRLESASLSMELLESATLDEAVTKAMELKNLNDVRKDMTEKGVEKAFDIIENGPLLQDRVLVVYIEDLHESLAGIVAGRVREKYYRPTLVITKGDDGLKGSGRSIEQYNMHEELSRISDLFIKFGGHKMAAGLSLKEDKLEELRIRLNENCSLTEDDLTPKICIDVPMPLSYVTEKLIGQLELLEPFGVGNPKPVFADKNVSFLNCRLMGKNRDMAKFTVTTDGRNRFELLLFRNLDEFKKALDGKYGEGSFDKLLDGCRMEDGFVMDIIYYPGINEFRGNRTLQYIINDYK